MCVCVTTLSTLDSSSLVRPLPVVGVLLETVLNNTRMERCSMVLFAIGVLEQIHGGINLVIDDGTFFGVIGIFGSVVFVRNRESIVYS